MLNMWTLNAVKGFLWLIPTKKCALWLWTAGSLWCEVTDSDRNLSKRLRFCDCGFVNRKCSVPIGPGVQTGNTTVDCGRREFLLYVVFFKRYCCHLAGESRAQTAASVAADSLSGERRARYKYSHCAQFNGFVRIRHLFAAFACHLVWSARRRGVARQLM